MSTKIEWAEEVWNPITGCTKISAGCKNCYAARMAPRLAGRFGYPKGDPFKVTVHHDKMELPLKWKKPRTVFVCSMGDLFHKAVPFEAIRSVIEIICKCQQHRFIVLTKRAKRMADFIEYYAGKHTNRPWPCDYSHIVFGVSVEDQATADERIPELLATPAVCRFVSYEPALGPVDFKNIRLPKAHDTESSSHYHINCLTDADDDHFYNVHPKINGIIMGGESGPGARPMHPEWARQARDDCAAAGVPFFFKQWGEWTAARRSDNSSGFERICPSIGITDNKKIHEWPSGEFSIRVGKKKAGRFLDGKEHNDLPWGNKA